MTNDLSQQFTGRYAVITGSTQGLGAAAADLFVARGAAGLVICGRNIDLGEAKAAQLTEAGCPTHFVRADLADIDDCAAVIAKADAAFGNLHCLVNCAGITDRGSIWDTTPELWDAMFAVNTRAPFFLMQGAAKIMARENTPGSMINILSMSGHGGQPFITAYCGSKGALATLTRNIAYSLLHHRIRVNALNIGWMDTPGEHRIQTEYHGADENWLTEAEADLPFGRLLKPSEVARAIAFLAADESGMMTGSIIDFDQSILGTYDGPAHPAK